jgi:hypothetical protein
VGNADSERKPPRHLTIWFLGGALLSFASAYLGANYFLEKGVCVSVEFVTAMLTFDGLMVAALAISFPRLLGRPIANILSVPFVVSAIFCLHVALWAEPIDICGIGAFIQNNQSLYLAIFFLLLGAGLWFFGLMASLSTVFSDEG